MHKAFVGFLIIFGFFFLFEGQTQAAGDGEGVSGYRLAAQDGRDYESLYKGLGTKGGSNDPGTRDVGDSNVPSDSRIDSSVSGKELTPAQWAAVLGLMTLKGIGHSSCILAQRPSMGVMLNTQGEPRDGSRYVCSDQERD